MFCNEVISISVILTWIGENDKMVQRDYAEMLSNTVNGWRCLYKIIKAPDTATGLKLKLDFK